MVKYQGGEQGRCCCFALNCRKQTETWGRGKVKEGEEGGGGRTGRVERGGRKGREKGVQWGGMLGQEGGEEGGEC